MRFVDVETIEVAEISQPFSYLQAKMAMEEKVEDSTGIKEGECPNYMER